MTKIDTSNKENEKFFDKLKILHKHTPLIIGAETFDDLSARVYDAIDDTIKSDFMSFVKIHLGAVRGSNYRPGMGILPFSTLGSPLDGPGIMVRAANTKKIMNIPDTRKDPDYDPAWIAPPEKPEPEKSGHFLSELAVPIVTHGKSIAVVNIEHRDLNAYDEADQRLLETIAQYAGFALARIMHEDRLKGLHRHSSLLSNVKSRDEIVENTLDAMLNTLNFEICEFALVKEGELQSVSQAGIDEALKIRAQKRMDRTAPRAAERIREELDFKSELEVPVVIGNDVVGILNAKSIQPEAYSMQDKELLETLALHVGSAISRLNRADEIKELAYKLNSLEQGSCYLYDSHERCLQAYAVLSMENIPGLCIIREDPRSLMDSYGIKKAEIVLLSSRPFEDYANLEDLQSISRRLSKFLESGEGVVLLDGLEYLITRFGFDSVYSFVQEKRFDFLKSKAVLLVPLEMKTLDERQLALLSSEFKLLG